MSRQWKSKDELCHLAARLRLSCGIGPQSVALQEEARQARAFAWFDVLDDVIHLWAEEVREAAPKSHDPIVWDGTDEALEAIRDALPSFWVNVGGVPPCDGGENAEVLLIEQDVFGALIPFGIIAEQGRIQIVGDSFVILPPEVTA